LGRGRGTRPTPLLGAERRGGGVPPPALKH
jgi:hypothetical protein